MTDPSPSVQAIERDGIRRAMRRRRAGLPATEIRAAAESIARKVLKLPAMQRARRVAIYMSVGGEIDCQPLADRALLRKKRIFAPVLARKRLFFAALDTGAPLRKNRFGILEPAHARGSRLPPRSLDVVIVPLTAFDRAGNRMGMGAGFYDRTLAFRLRQKKWRRPLLIGVAYSFQRVDTLQPQPWDVPLDVVVTEQECFGSC